MDCIIRTSFKPNTAWPFPRAFDDLFTSADYVDVIADKISDFLAHILYDGSGIYNIGTERKSVYQLAHKRNIGVRPMSRKEITNVCLPSDISMNTERFDNTLRRMMDND
jgi:dTDP-4-dehydrorhamnose reductase